MFRPIAARIVALLLAAGMAASCVGPHRDQTSEDPALNQALSFLQEPDVDRKAVEARLGLPKSTFESGRVVVYRVEMENPVELKAVTPSWWQLPGHQLIIEYDKDGRVVRYNALR